MQRTLLKFGPVLRRLGHARSLSLTAYKFSDGPNTEQPDRTTHFGFETVTEAQKEQKGLLS